MTSEPVPGEDFAMQNTILTSKIMKFETQNEKSRKNEFVNKCFSIRFFYFVYWMLGLKPVLPPYKHPLHSIGATIGAVAHTSVS